MILSTDWAKFGVEPNIKGIGWEKFILFFSLFLSHCFLSFSCLNIMHNGILDQAGIHLKQCGFLFFTPGAFLVSGIYDLEPIMHTYVNDLLHMSR